MKWKTKVKYVDADTGEVLNPEDNNNYTIIKKLTTTYIQNGNGIKELTYECKRIYEGDLFSRNQ